MNNLQKEKSCSILLLKLKALTCGEIPQRHSYLTDFSVVSTHLDHLIMESSLDSVSVGSCSYLTFARCLIPSELLE